MSLNYGNLYIISGISYIIHTFSGFVGNKKSSRRRRLLRLQAGFKYLLHQYASSYPHFMMVEIILKRSLAFKIFDV